MIGVYPPHRVTTLITPPTSEPLTIDAAKLRAGLDWPNGDPRDLLMRDFIAAARAQVEADTGVALLTQTYDVTYAAATSGPLILPWRPVQTVRVFAEEADGAHELDPGDYVLDPGSVWPVPARLQAPLGVALTVETVVGHPDVATLTAAAPGLLHAVGLLVAHYATFGRDLVLPGAAAAVVPMGYVEAIAPYQLVTLI